MRYLNWDVLLFPAGSKIPMQEFKTGCYAVQDPELLGTDPVAGLPAGTLAFDTLTSPQVPIVACFLANQTDGSPFRVSLHSWEKPNASQSLQVFAKHGGKHICFEARVFIDGLCLAGTLFQDDGPWPQVIEVSSLVDKEGNRDLLRWPRFRGEMLTQTYWNAGEDKGRVKVTITEGYLHGPGIFPFTRTKNLVSFSFQHAPQNILENTGIAWPNAGMWYQSSRPVYHIASPGKRGGPSEDMDLHAHSPRKRMDSMTSLEERMGHNRPIQNGTFGSMQPPPTMQPPVLSEFRYNNHAPDWASTIPMQDPFVESSRYMNRRYGNRSNESDQPMPDYSRSITPASLQNAPHDIQTQLRSITALHNEAIFNDVESIFNAQNNTPSGVVAPANTRVSSAANTPPIQSRPSAAAEARAASYTSTHERSRAVSITTKDAPPKPREPSDVSMKSQFSEDQPGTKPTAESKPHPKLATEVKGRKEGKGSEQFEAYPLIQKRASKSSIKTSGNGKENTTATVTTTVVLSDGKRKRASTASGNQLSAKDEEALGSSPTKKFSKKISSPAAVIESPEILVVARAPLDEVENAI